MLGLVAIVWTTGAGAACAQLDPEPAAGAEVRAADGREAFVQELPGTLVSFRMVPVPGGAVDGEPIAPFYMADTELTWDLYDVFLYRLDEKDGAVASDAVSRPSKPYVLPGEHFGHQDHPALGMSHRAARAFTAWLTERTGRTYRLATDAEWTHACRLGRAGDAEPGVWTWENAEDETHPVGTLAPDALGLYDVVGHVAEWVEGADGEPVIRGGSFQDDAEDVGCDARAPYDPAWQMTDPQLPKSTWWFSDAPFVGLRVVHAPD